MVKQIGSIIFHDINIKKSYRTRGNEHRVHTNMKTINIIFSKVVVPPINRIIVKNLRINIIPYSLIKIKENIPPPYSMLKPDTISDSPSAVSNGVRLDSAKHSKIHTMVIKGAENPPHTPC